MKRQMYGRAGFSPLRARSFIYLSEPAVAHALSCTKMAEEPNFNRR